MAFLTDTERATLTAICDTLIPALEGDSPAMQYSAADSNVAERVEEAFEATLSQEQRDEIQTLLKAFDVGAFNAMFSGRWQAFRKMPRHQRERLLADWGRSRLKLRRKAFQAFKRLVLFLGYANLPEADTHPVWQTIDYPGPPGASETIERTITPTPITDNRTLTCDVLVVGSGAGGGVVAAELAAAGYDVIVAEKGGYFAEADFHGNERQASEDLFEQNAALTNATTDMMILAGATLGGGTTVNWNASFRTPQHVLREWANTYGISEALSDTWQHSLDAVSQRLHVTCDESHLNANNRVFSQGLDALGYHQDVIPRNVSGCEDCGFCNYGCRYGAKQGTLKTYLQDAYDDGARILVNAEVKRVMHEAGNVTGAIVEAQDSHDESHVHLLTIRATSVVVAAGTIHTPAVLKRSGLDNAHIGRNLHLHPTAVIFSLFDEPIRTWEGVPMSRVSKQFSDLDGNGYGVALEVAPSHPGLIAATFPWVSAAQHRQLVIRMNRMANIIALTRDYYGGHVEVTPSGKPVLHYQLHPHDKQHMQRGILEALKVHYAAGACEVYAPHNNPLRFHREEGDSAFVRFLRKVEDCGIEPNALPLFSAHQMSSARMAGSPRQGVLKPNGETWEIRRLFVADGSAMPTATGVNPMLSIMGTAHVIAQHIKAALN
jgi:choline dehydrogenase-like flavoprotein